MSLCLPFLLLCGGIVQTNVSAEARLSVHGDCFVGRLSLVELYETAAFKVATFPIRQPSDFANLTAVLEKGFARFVVNVVRQVAAEDGQATFWLFREWLLFVRLLWGSWFIATWLWLCKLNLERSAEQLLPCLADSQSCGFGGGKCDEARAEKFASLLVRKPINVNNFAAY